MQTVTTDCFNHVPFKDNEKGFELIKFVLDNDEDGWVVAELTKSTALSTVMFEIITWGRKNHVKVDFIPFFDDYEEKRIKAVFMKESE